MIMRCLWVCLCVVLSVVVMWFSRCMIRRWCFGLLWVVSFSLLLLICILVRIWGWVWLYCCVICSLMCVFLCWLVMWVLWLLCRLWRKVLIIILWSWWMLSWFWLCCRLMWLKCRLKKCLRIWLCCWWIGLNGSIFSVCWLRIIIIFWWLCVCWICIVVCCSVSLWRSWCGSKWCINENGCFLKGLFVFYLVLCVL